MRRVAALLLALGLVAGTMTATARAQDADVKITVVGHDGKSVKGADVDVFWISSLENGDVHTQATTGDDGTVTVKVPVKHQIFATAHDGAQIEQKGSGTTGPVYGQPPAGFTVTLRVDIATEVKLIQEAADNCDPDAYDKHLGYLKIGIADQEARVEDRRKKAEAYAGENDIPYPDLESAEKALKSSRKLAGTGVVTKESAARQAKLATYVEMLRALKIEQNTLDTYKKRLDGLPKRPACKSGAMVPNACPPGAGGGLLAGGLNQVLGTDLQPACVPPERRNDTRGRDSDERQGDRRD